MQTSDSKNETKITQQLRCQLTDEEKIQAGKELAEATNEVASLGNKIRSGYEFRPVECSVTMDTPEPGQKQTVRLDTKEVVATAAMSEDEKQRKLELESE